MTAGPPENVDDLTPIEVANLRRQPCTDDEIIALAQSMWDDRDLQQIFVRVTDELDFTEDEDATVEAVIDAYRTGDLWDRSHTHLSLAPVLCRKRAAGLFGPFDTADALAFLQKQKPKLAGHFLYPKLLSMEESLQLVEEIIHDPETWAIVGNRLKLGVESKFTSKQVKRKVWAAEASFAKRHGYFHRVANGGVWYLLVAYANGEIESVRDEIAIQEADKRRTQFEEGD